MKNPTYTNQIRLTRNRGEVLLEFLFTDNEGNAISDPNGVAMTHDTYEALRQLLNGDAPKSESEPEPKSGSQRKPKGK